MSPAALSEEIAKTKKKTSKPFGVNLILMHPQLDALIEVCREHNVSHVVLAGGIPKKVSAKYPEGRDRIPPDELKQQMDNWAGEIEPRQAVEADPNLVDLFKLYRARWWQRMAWLRLPSALSP